MLPCSLFSRSIDFYKNTISMHFPWLPLPFVKISIRKQKLPFPLLLSLNPVSNIRRTIIIIHSSLSLSSVVFPATVIDVTISISVNSFSLLFVFYPSSFVSLAIWVNVRSSSIFFILLPFTRISILIVNYQLAKSFLFPIFPITFIDSFIPMINVIPLSVRLSIYPLSFIYVPIWVIISADTALNIVIPISFVPISIRIMIGTMTFSDVFLPLTIILSLI